MTARAHLHLVDTGTGEAEQTCHGCQALLKKVAALASENTKLRNAEDERLGKAPDAPQIMDVLTFHKRLLVPRGRIVRGGPAWKNVKARLLDVDAESEKPAFTVLHLKAASVGLSMSEWHRTHKKLGAAFLYADPDRVQEFISAASQFKRETGTSALSIIDELGRGGYERLADLCDCGHIRLDHEKEREELGLFHPPCAVHGCACPGFQTSPLWEQLRWAAEREREIA